MMNLESNALIKENYMMLHYDGLRFHNAIG
jgi:hypothetical protein